MTKPLHINPIKAGPGRSSRMGFSLLELMMVVFIMTAVLGVLFSLSLSMTDVSIFQMNKSVASDEARRGMEFLSRQLRNAAKASLSTLPAATISFQVARDVDGNGSAVDKGGNIELSPAITVGRDTADANNDGVATNQLIMKDGTTVTVLANNLLPDDGVSNHGVWFERDGNAVRITLQTRALTRRGNVITSTLVETVLPRN